MSLKCYVDNNVVVDGPRVVPANWVDPKTGISYSNFDSLTDPQHLSLGWYVYVLVDPGSPGAYYTRTLSAFVINSTSVTQTATYSQLPIEEVRAQKDTELRSQVRLYTANELSADPAVQEYIENDLKWLVDEQAKLARTTDWQAVADFDTAKPEVLVLPNNYTGRSYVRQGEQLTSQNLATVEAGGTARWPDADVKSFVAANQLAADDPSGNTLPLEPKYTIRQGVATPQQKSSRVVIYRFDRDDPNPALQRSYAMRLFDKQNNRDLYVFSYTNSTYLTWNQFVQQSDGTWWFEAQAAEMQYTDTDLGFIFSYGTNPAVEADYFTDRVSFPAGVDQQDLLVAWDQTQPSAQRR